MGHGGSHQAGGLKEGCHTAEEPTSRAEPQTICGKGGREVDEEG